MNDKTERINPDDGAQMCAVMRLIVSLRQNVAKLETLQVQDILSHGSYCRATGTVGIVVGACRISEHVDQSDA